MPFMGTLKSGNQYKIIIDSDPNTPGMTATVFGWIPPPGAQPQTPTVDTIAPGARAVHTGQVPQAQALLLDCDMPDAPGARITLTVEENSTVIAQDTRTVDTDWSFLVKP